MINQGTDSVKMCLETTLDSRDNFPERGGWKQTEKSQRAASSASVVWVFVDYCHSKNTTIFSAQLTDRILIYIHLDVEMKTLNLRVSWMNFLSDHFFVNVCRWLFGWFMKEKPHAATFCTDSDALCTLHPDWLVYIALLSSGGGKNWFLDASRFMCGRLWID